MTTEILAGLTIDHVLTTTRAVRKRIDLERPVARETVAECLRLAFQAPNGANAQNWGWVVVEDGELKTEMTRLYRAGWSETQARYYEGKTPPVESGYVGEPGRQFPFFEKLPRVPMLLVPAYRSKFGDGTGSTFEAASMWGSILPAVWTLMLALRSRGLGSVWTTVHLHYEKEMAALLGIPDGYTQAGMFPIFYTLGTRFSPGDRTFSEGRIFWNRWGERD
jgi:nitroreductase